MHINNPAQLGHQVLSDAADWYALLRSGEAKPEDNQRWLQWLHQHPDHLLGWQLVERIEQQFNVATGGHPTHTEATLQQVRQHRLQRRNLLKGMGAAIATAGLGWASWQHTPLPQLAASWQAQYRTGTGEIRHWALADGSQLWLDSNSAADTRLAGPQRQIRLLRGQILIQTGDDPRPMVVRSSHGEMRPLGTRFSVRFEQDETRLAVYQGAVEITTLSQQRRVVARRQQTGFNNQHIASPTTASDTQQAWHQKRFIAEDIRLDDLIEALSRYQPGYIQLSPAVAELRVFGSFPLDHPQQALAMLETALPIHIQRPLPWWTRIDAAAAQADI